MKISVVVPCRNAAGRLRPTLESILGQRAVRRGRVALELLVCDGASTDGTPSLAREICGDAADVRSEPDGGMYEALAKGLSRATGDVCAYLNAGDLYDPGAFDVVADVMDGGAVRWLTGMIVRLNDRLEVIEASVPFRYRRDWIAKGLYGPVLPFVQQEATFWHRSLLGRVDLPTLAGFKLAGDYYLWRQFATEADLVIVESTLGGFVHHEGQLSEDLGGYFSEMDRIRQRPGGLDLLRARVELKLWELLPPNWKKRLNPLLLRYDRGVARWA